MKVVEALLQIPELDVNAVDSKGCSALHWSAALGDIEAMTKLLARKDCTWYIVSDKTLSYYMLY